MLDPTIRAQSRPRYVDLSTPWEDNEACPDLQYSVPMRHSPWSDSVDDAIFDRTTGGGDGSLLPSPQSYLKMPPVGGGHPFEGGMCLPVSHLETCDKSAAEAGVLFTQRQILAPLRNVSFFSLLELNAAILEVVKAFNRTPFQKMSGTRQSRFEDVDQPALRPLPTNPYEYGVWTSMRKVAPDYHVQIDKHCYSVPYSYLGRSVRGLVRPSTVEIYDGDNRIASHVRSQSDGRYTTDPLHMPDHHREYARWSPQRFIDWAQTIGPQTTALIQANFAWARIPEQVYRRCMAILRQENEFGRDVLEKACGIALERQTLSSPAVKQILKRIATQRSQTPPIDHENIRGAHYYSSNGTD